MKRQDYYPSLLPEQVLWLDHFARELPRHAARLRISAGDLEGAAADAAWLAYLLGPCRTGARAWAKSLSALLAHAQDGTGTEPVAAPAYEPPVPPAGVGPRPPGALQRVFRTVRLIKVSHRGDTALLQALGLTTRPDERVHTSTRLRISLERAGDGQIVIVRGKRWGHAGLLVESRRGSGDWEEIGILGSRALRDTRPLAVRGQPEVREYRARFFDGTTEISREWSPVEGVTVSG